MTILSVFQKEFPKPLTEKCNDILLTIESFCFVWVFKLHPPGLTRSASYLRKQLRALCVYNTLKTRKRKWCTSTKHQ